MGHNKYYLGTDDFVIRQVCCKNLNFCEHAEYEIYKYEMTVSYVY